MGMHCVPSALVMDGELDATRPEIVIDAPQPDGSLHLIGAGSLVFADAWHATHASPLELMGQLLPLFEAPIASGCRRSTRCTGRRGRTAPPGRSCTGTPTCRVTPSAGHPPDVR